jgi:phosphate transport system protein
VSPEITRDGWEHRKGRWDLGEVVFEGADAGRAEPLRELRRSYHDRIALVRQSSLEVLQGAISGTSRATQALLADSSPDALAGTGTMSEVEARAAQIDTEVLELLALESPVARDLRVILASRDITQLGLLCVGLGSALSDRVVRVRPVLTAELRRKVGAVGSGTGLLLSAAEGAWATLDADLAAAVVPQAATVRAGQTEFIQALIALEGVPMEAALHLAVVSRVFERLADHAVEIAERVRFAVEGIPGHLPEP